jgi:ribonuclease-3
LLGRTEVRSNGHEKDSILADTMEAVIGALYLEGGLAPVERFAREIFADALSPEAPRVERDPKSRLNEWVMAAFGMVPTYRTLADTGIAEDEARYTVEVRIREDPVAQGVARSKQEAEQRAAAVAYESREKLEASGSSHE